MTAPGNLFADLPSQLPEELVTTLLSSGNVRIERIVSPPGHSSPEGFWYDQDRPEWVVVLRGAAKLRFEDETVLTVLGVGDSLLIPAHRKHRVEWTMSFAPTVWLAVFL